MNSHSHKEIATAAPTPVNPPNGDPRWTGIATNTTNPCRNPEMNAPMKNDPASSGFHRGRDGPSHRYTYINTYDTTTQSTFRAR